MAIAFRASATAGDDDLSSLTISKPAGVQDGDIMIALLYREGSSWTLPAGWTQLAEQAPEAGCGYHRLTVAWKRASSEGASYTFTLAASDWVVGIILAFSGCAPTGNPVDTYAGHAADSFIPTVRAASITPSSDGCMLVIAASSMYETITAGSSGYTAVTKATTTMLYREQATAAATGEVVLNDIGSQCWATVHLALLPEGGGPEDVEESLTLSASRAIAPRGVLAVSEAITVSHSLAAGPGSSADLRGGITETRLQAADVAGVMDALGAVGLDQAQSISGAELLDAFSSVALGRSQTTVIGGAASARDSLAAGRVHTLDAHGGLVVSVGLALERALESAPEAERSVPVSVVYGRSL
ncbi:MAG: hypothetical protein RBT75_19375, partial [Anaerolineae bacterium]|nr:hypothetical protein [Anaerolineae bacterium]